MLNFGGDIIFLRLLLVFDKFKVEGDFMEKEMWKYVIGNYLLECFKLIKGKKVNLKFFFEGGNLVWGIEFEVVFEVIDIYGNFIIFIGIVINEEK